MKETPKQYLDKKRNMESDEDKVAEVERILQEPLSNIAYEREPKGSVSAERGLYKITFDYARSEKETLKIEKEELRIATLYEMRGLTFERPDKNLSLNFEELAPGYKFIFCPDVDNVSSYVSIDGKRVVLVGNPASLGSILTVLHEVGHIHEQALPDRFDEYAPHVELAEKLHSERSAWAYALKKIKPFLDDIEGNPLHKSNALLYAKERALYTYAEWVNDQLHHHAAMDHFARNMFPDQFEDYPEDDATVPIDVGWPVKKR
ncbi:MAG: hypothetical protein Q8R25_04110 [bacterium]|nr:hypothetical protein [bacterium]